MAQAASRPAVLPRLGFLGLGWIGRARMEAVLASGRASACAICDPAGEMISAARPLAPQASAADTLEALLEEAPDGIVIATPNALHAEQSIRALEAGVAVFCQKPLGRDAREVEAVIEAARRADRLLGVDFSYRHTAAMRAVRGKIREGAIGRIYAADLVFHNAYGPDKPWFYDPAQSGGGCVMDLGIHLVDLLLWSLAFPAVERVAADLYGGGRRLWPGEQRTEDYATATLALADGVTARMACSWRLHAGCGAVISATFHGTEGSLAFSNVAGSFYDFRAELRRGTSAETLVEPPDAWGGRAALEWVERLATANRFHPDADEVAQSARVLDALYGR